MDEFQCDDYSCISGSAVCDGVSDCRDRSDEANCGTYYKRHHLVRILDEIRMCTWHKCNNLVNSCADILSNIIDLLTMFDGRSCKRPFYSILIFLVFLNVLSCVDSGSRVSAV